MLLAGRRKRRLSWIIRQDGEEFRLSAHGEARLFVCVYHQLCSPQRDKERKSTSPWGASRRGSLECITLGYHMYGELVFPAQLQ